jgi:kynurenine formamidase
MELPMPAIIRAARMRLMLLAPFLLGGWQAAAGDGLDIAKAKIVDLTHAIDADTIFWPTEQKTFELIEEHNGITEGGFFYAANRLCLPEHGGTHVDAPYHFARDGEKVGEMPVSRFVGPAVVIDVADKAAADPDYTLRPEDVTAWEARHGTIAPGAIVLLRTGWSSRWPEKRAYLGDDTPGDASNLHFPSFGPEAAKLLVARKVSMIGVDTASIDNGPSKDFLVHRIMGEAGIAGLENLANLEAIPATGAWIAALPIKIAKGSGAPARVVAFVP